MTVVDVEWSLGKHKTRSRQGEEGNMERSVRHRKGGREGRGQSGQEEAKNKQRRTKTCVKVRKAEINRRKVRNAF